LLERRPERVVQRLFSDVEVSEQPDQGGENAAGFCNVDGVHRFAYWIGRRHVD
jgi:hypothetical protein